MGGLDRVNTLLAPWSSAAPAGILSVNATLTQGPHSSTVQHSTGLGRPAG